MATINSYLTQADNLRFKLLAVTGKNESKKEKIIKFLSSENWKQVDVGEALVNLSSDIESPDEKIELELVSGIG